MSISATREPLEDPTARTERGRRHAALSSPIAWITLAWAGMLTLFMVIVPIYQAPDEHTHVDRVLSTAVVGFPDYDALLLNPELVASTRIVGLSARPEPLRAEEAPARPVPTFAELASGPVNPAAVNQLAGHPPAYYALMGGLRSVATQLLPRDLWQFDRDVLLLRLFNVLLMVGLPWVLARTARAMGMAPWQSWIAAALPLCIPQLAHIGSAVNNDTLLIMASALTTLFAAVVLTGGLQWGPTLGMALATGVAIQTKIFGWALVPMVAVVALMALRGRRRDWPRVAVAAFLVAASGWTYLRNLLLHGHPYPVQAPAGQPVAPDDFSFSVVAFVAHLGANTTQSFIGKFGTLWLSLPRPWTLLVSAALAAALVVAVAIPGVRGLRVLLLPVAVIIALYLFTSTVAHLSTGQYAAQQGRYLFPVVGSLALAVACAARWLGRWPAGIGLATVAGVGWVLSAWTLLTGFWAGSLVGRAASIAAWSPIGAASLAVLLAAAVAFWVGLGMALRSATLRSRQTRDLVAPEPESAR